MNWSTFWSYCWRSVASAKKMKINNTRVYCVCVFVFAHICVVAVFLLAVVDCDCMCQRKSRYFLFHVDLSIAFETLPILHMYSLLSVWHFKVTKNTYPMLAIPVDCAEIIRWNAITERKRANFFAVMNYEFFSIIQTLQLRSSFEWQSIVIIR